MWLLAFACRTEPTGVERITAEGLRADVERLAADEMRGRGTGTPEIARAGELIAQRFAAAGLQPLPGEDDRFHRFTLHRRGLDRARTQLTLFTDDETVPARLGGTWRPLGLSDAGAATADVVFAGYGITAPEHGYDDYAGLDVEGRIVLLLRHEPGEADPESPFGGLQVTEHATFERKARNAREHGAVGYLIVTDPLHHGPTEDLRLDEPLSLGPPNGGAAPPEGAPLLAAQIARSVAERLVAGAGRDLVELQRALDAGKLRPADVSLGARAELVVARAERSDEVPERNVVAMLPGSERPGEWVVIGAHYDHLGGFEGPGDVIFNGADDNASGTAGLLALADALGSLPAAPARSIVLQAYAAEEEGLLGSEAWVRDHGTDHVVFMLNLDMIGRNPRRSIEAIGDGYSTGTTALVQAAGRAAGLDDLQLGGLDYAGNSDHHPFAQAGVPFLFFFTGLHADYHQVTDQADRLDYPRMARIVRAAWHVAMPIARAEVTPRSLQPVPWLGVTLQGRVVATVDAGSRAAEAGLVVGDVVDDVGEEDDDDLVGSALRDVEPGRRVGLRVRRGDETVTVEVERGRPGFLGVGLGDPSPEQLEAAGLREGVLVERLLPEGPAAGAEVRVGDVIAEIDGTTVSRASLKGTLQRLGAGRRVELLVLRDGEQLTIPLVLGERR